MTVEKLINEFYSRRTSQVKSIPSEFCLKIICCIAVMSSTPRKIKMGPETASTNPLSFIHHWNMQPKKQI